MAEICYTKITGCLIAAPLEVLKENFNYDPDASTALMTEKEKAIQDCYITLDDMKNSSVLYAKGFFP